LKNIKTVVLLLTAAVAIGGRIMRAGERVEVTEDEARDLLHRGRATVCEGFTEPAGDGPGDVQFAENTAGPQPGEVIGEVGPPVQPIVAEDPQVPPAVVDAPTPTQQKRKPADKQK
jgi:hypothetical protein